ncbi:MAG: putative RNA-binding protein containing KH domain, possibly ribosomal protein [uncultured archaeon A07HR60]|jgi:RNA-binding protein|nr:MAG: putative RNA-binding protein containing KH domain, possibly ribosomal protein [uncultured archaeon A07HR60]
MVDEDLRAQAHDLDVTVWVGKKGIDAVVEELDGQLSNENLVKIKFLRAARSAGSTEELATELADSVSATLVETRGNTGVLHR